MAELDILREFYARVVAISQSDNAERVLRAVRNYVAQAQLESAQQAGKADRAKAMPQATPKADDLSSST